MTNDLFTELSIVIAIGSIVALIMHLLRQPLIIGHILTGVLVGPAVFDVLHNEEIVEVFSKIGIALLLFIIGLGLNVKVIKELGKVSVLAGTIQIFFTTTIGYLGAQIMGYSMLPSLVIGVAIAFSSTIIVLKLISDKKEQNRLYGKISIGILLVQDLFATAALLVATALGNDALELNDIFGLAIKGFMLGTILIFSSLYIFPHITKLVSESQEFLFLFAIGWGLGIASVFEIMGFSIEIGALLAGVALAHMPYAQEVSSRLRPLRDFFIVLFFIQLGLLINIDALSGAWGEAIIFSLMVLIFNPFIIMFTLGFMGYTKSTSFKTAVAMAQISEFSLVFAILVNQGGRLDDAVLTMLTLVAIITIAISTYLIIYADQLFRVFEKQLALFERRKVRYEQKDASKYELVLFGYNKGGGQFVKVFRNLKRKFVVIDYDPEVIDHLERKKVHHLYGDATDPELLDEVGIEASKLVVSTIGEYEVNKYITTQVHSLNPKAVIIVSAETPQHAAELYDHGASYVMMPHYIGSEKIGSFIKRNGFRRGAFKDWREKHILALQEHTQHLGS